MQSEWMDAAGDSAHLSVVPNVTERGSFSERYQRISLKSVTKEMFEATRKRGQGRAEALAQVHPLLCHELRHWLDFVGTLWGQRQLAMLFDAVNSRINDDPKQFMPIARYYRELFKSFFLHYYTTNRGVGGPDRWRLQRSVGHRFSCAGEMLENSLILLVNFSNPDGAPIGRSPLSVSSLLETGAMFSEMLAIGQIASTVSELEREDFAGRQFSAFLHNFLYRSEMRVYSVAAHVVANALDSRDPFWSLAVSSGLANLALNLCDSHFIRLRRADTFDGIEEGDPNLLHDDFRRDRDRSYAFISLLDNLKQSTPTSILGSLAREAVDSFAELALLQSDLGSAAEVQQDIVREMESIPPLLVEGPLRPHAETLLEVGRKAFEQRGLLGLGLTEMDAIEDGTFVPPLVLGDESIYVPKPAKGRRVWGTSEEVATRWARIADAFGKMGEFYRICGI